MERRSSFCQVVAIYTLILALGPRAQAQYGGGTGEPNDPYLIYTPEQMNAIGADPNDWDKHFKLMADIDLSSYRNSWFNLIGGDRENPFAGTFDGNGHTIAGFSYWSTVMDYVGLFRCIDGRNAEVKNLGLIAPDINAGEGRYVGALAGRNEDAVVKNCFVEGGVVRGGESTGGLVGQVYEDAVVKNCFVEGGVVRGGENTGGLVGQVYEGAVRECYADTEVVGSDVVGGLAGDNLDRGTIKNCYAAGTVTGNESVGGLAGRSGDSHIISSHSMCLVVSAGDAGGLTSSGAWHTEASFWNVETSGQDTSDGGTGLTTAQMEDPNTFIVAGWDFFGPADGPNDVWAIAPEGGAPILWWQSPKPNGLLFAGGVGTSDEPYRIASAEDLNRIGENPRFMESHFLLIGDIDLEGVKARPIGSRDFPFAGVFNGDGHALSNLSLARADDGRYAGLFRYVRGGGARIENLTLINPIISAKTTDYVGALVGHLGTGVVTGCCVDGGAILGDDSTGGLVGYNDHGVITTSCAVAEVTGSYSVGGLVGRNGRGAVRMSWSASTVTGFGSTGGLIGYNAEGAVRACYAGGIVTGHVSRVGGLIGWSGGYGREHAPQSSVMACYSTARVTGDLSVGGLVGLVGWAQEGHVVSSFWDVETSGQASSAGGTGLTMGQMQTAAPFLEAGWDFVGEVANGEEDIWWIDEGRDYPRLWWEAADAEF